MKDLIEQIRKMNLPERTEDFYNNLLFSANILDGHCQEEEYRFSNSLLSITVRKEPYYMQGGAVIPNEFKYIVETTVGKNHYFSDYFQEWSKDKIENKIKETIEKIVEQLCENTFEQNPYRRFHRK